MEEESLEIRWPGLNAFTEKDEELFFGREKDISQLKDYIIENAYCIVFGPSGVGKTSILQAGVLPQLRQCRYFPVYIRLDHDTQAKSYVRQIVDAFLLATEEHHLKIIEIGEALSDKREETLWEWFHRHEFQNALKMSVYPVLILDQFEEVFTLGTDKLLSERWLDELTNICSNSIPEKVLAEKKYFDKEICFPTKQCCHVVICLRDDFLPRLDELAMDYPIFSQRRIPIRALQYDQALEIIIKSSKGAIDIEEARRTVNYVRGRSGIIETPILSLICTHLDLIQQNKEDKKVLDDLMEYNKDNILMQFYDGAMGVLLEPSREYLEKALLNQNGYRNTLQFEEAKKKGVTQQELDSLLKKRILHIIERDKVPWIEFSHDIFVPMARASIEKSKQKRKLEEMNEKLKLQRQRIRKISLLFFILLVLIGLASYFSWFFFFKENVEYYRDFVKVWGIPRGIGTPLTLEQVRHRTCSFRLLRHSRYTFDLKKGGIPRIIPSYVYRVDAINGSLKSTINHNIGTYFWDKKIITDNFFKKDLSTGKYIEDKNFQFQSSSSLNTVCSWEYSIDKNGKAEREMGLNQNHDIIWIMPYNFVKTENEQNNIAIVHFILDNGFPVSQSGLEDEYVRLTYNPENGYEVSCEYLNKKGKPVMGYKGSYSYFYRYNEQGNVTEERRIGADGCPSINEEGISVLKWQYDEYGNKIKELYFNNYGLPISLSDKISAIHWQYDEYGNRIEERYLSVDGLPKADSTGVSVIKCLYDNKGNLIEKRYLGVDNTPVVNAIEGVSVVKYKYSNYQNVQKDLYSLSGIGVFCKTSGAFDPHDRNIQHVMIKYDKHGNSIEERWFDSNDYPIADKNGVSIIKRNYDSIGNLVEINYYDINGSLTINNGIYFGMATIKRQYDILGNIVEYRFLGVDGSLIADMLGRAIKKYKYNEQGKIIEEKYLGVDGSLIKKKGEPAIIKHKYDDNGHLIESHYLGFDGSPITIGSDDVIPHCSFEIYDSDNIADPRVGISIVKYQYNKDGKCIDERYFDGSNHPVINKYNKICIIKRNFDEYGNKIEEHYLGIDGSPIVNNRGISVLKKQYLIGGNVQIDLYSLPGKGGVLGNEKFHHVYMLKDSHGYDIEQRYYGVDGSPVVDLNGCYQIKNSYYDKNHGIKRVDYISNAYANDRSKMNSNKFTKFIGIVSIDNRGQKDLYALPGQGGIGGENAVHHVTQILDSYANVIEERYFGVDESSVVCKDGATIIKNQYANGKRVRRDWYALNGKGGVWGIANVHHGCQILDSDENVIEVRYFDINDSPCVDNNGVSIYKYKYDSKMIFQRDLYALHGQGGVFKEANVHHVCQILDTEGKIIDEKRFDSNGKELN